MSIENASRFIAKIQERDEAVLALLPEDVSPDAIGAEEIAAIAQAANAAGWEFTADELQEAYLDSLALDESELSAAAGGLVTQGEHRAKGPGGCTSNYYAVPCGATWEKDSLCTCTDFKEDTCYPKC